MNASHRCLLIVLTFAGSVVLNTRCPAQDSLLHWVIEPVAISFSQITGNGIEGKTTGMMLSTAFSAGAQWNLTKSLSVRILPGIEMKGTRFVSTLEEEFGLGEAELKGRHQYNYLMLPVLLHVRPGSEKKFYFNLGVYGGYLFRQTSYYKKTEETPKVDITRIDLPADRYDYGLCTGVGFYRDLSERIGMTFGVRACIGLYNISDPFLWPGGAIRHSNFALIFGLLLKPH